jgi:hypothetical protein
LDSEYILPVASKCLRGNLPLARLCERDCRKAEPLLDFFPEPAVVRNVWENKLALIKGERV